MIITMTIFSLVGISVISTTIPFNVNLKNEIRDLEYHFSTIIAQDGMTGNSFENISLGFDSLSVDNGQLYYSFVINLIYVFQEKNHLVSFIGLSNKLFDYSGLDDQKIVGSSEFGSTSINLTKAVPYYQSISEAVNETMYVANFSKVELETTNSIFSYIINTAKSSEFDRLYSPRSEYHDAPFYLIGNFSVFSELLSYFNIDTKELGAFSMVFLDTEFVDKMTIERLENEIDEGEKNIFNEYLERGFNPEQIYIHSPVKSLIQNFEVYVGYEIVSIQLLSTANLLLATVLLFLIDIGVYQILRKNENILLSRGFSKKKTVLLFMSIEFIVDLFVVILSLSVLSIIILLLNLPFSTFSFLIKTYSLLFIVFFLVKFLNLLIRTKRSLETKMKEDIGSKRTIRIQRSIIALVLILISLLQIFMIFEPLFWQPIIYGSLEIILDVISGVLTITALLALAITSGHKQKPKENDLELQNLLSRLFSKGLQKIKIQRIVTTCLYALLFYLIVYTVAKRSDTEYNKYGDLWDLTVTDDGRHGSGSLGTSDQINNLTSEITEIEQMCPGVFLLGNMIISNNGQITDTTLLVFNTTIIANQNLGWNHFFGSQNSGKTNHDISTLKEKEIILNQAIAENSNLKEGDNISIEVDLRRVGFESVSLRVDDVYVFGIVDTLYGQNGFSGAHHPYAFADISFYLDVCFQLGVEPQINTIGINVKSDDNLSDDEKETKIAEVFNMILGYLNLSESNVRFHSNSDKDSYYSLSYITAEQFFIYFDLVFCIVFIPMITVVFTKATIKIIAPSLAKLGARGYSDQELRYYFIRRIRKSLIMSILLGLFIGTLVGIIQGKYLLFSLLLPVAVNFYVIIGLFIASIVAVGSISVYLIIPFSTKQIQTIAEEKERKLSKNESNNN
jgi:hypothetical protein